MKSRAENIQQKPSGETEASAGFQVELSWQSFGLRHFPINSHLSLPAVVKTLCPLPGCFAILSPACHGVGGRGGQSIPDKSPGGHLTYMSLGLKCVCVMGEGRATCFSVSSNSPRQCANIIYGTGRVGLRRHLCSPLKWEESEVTNALPPTLPRTEGAPRRKMGLQVRRQEQPPGHENAMGFRAQL